MASRRVSFSLDEFTLEMVQTVAARAGTSTSAWLAQTVRQEAVRQGVGPGSVYSDADAVADDADLAESEADLRETG